MPVAFTPDERAAVRATLLEAGRAHFAARGLAKTPLHALTDAAGIAKSSFYAFFGSKEELWLELLADLAPQVEARVLEPTVDPERPPERSLADLVAELRAVYREEPLLRRLLEHPEDLAAIAARVGPRELAAKGRALAPLRDFVARAQAAGTLRADVPVDVVVGALQAVLLLELHADRLGAAHDPVVALWTEALARYLAVPRRGSAARSRSSARRPKAPERGRSRPGGAT